MRWKLVFKKQQAQHSQTTDGHHQSPEICHDSPQHTRQALTENRGAGKKHRCDDGS
ncbi:MAG: hypothetical protein ACI9R3_004270 [Verrucomicrobiales bacterium]|jgi:hypothetical protein